MRTLCWTPYFADGLLATLSGVLNPVGIFLVLASALPGTLGANAGLISLPFVVPKMFRLPENSLGPIERSWAWIAAAAVGALLFILVLGRGVTWSR